MKKGLLETIDMIKFAYNEETWADHMPEALAWGVVEVCFKCKYLHPPVGWKCKKLSCTIEDAYE